MARSTPNHSEIDSFQPECAKSSATEESQKFQTTIMYYSIILDPTRPKPLPVSDTFLERDGPRAVKVVDIIHYWELSGPLQPGSILITCVQAI